MKQQMAMPNVDIQLVLLRTKEKNCQVPGLVCSNVRSGNIDFKRSRQDEDRSLRNVDLETAGED